MGSLIPHSKPTLGEAEANAASAAVLSGFVGSGSRVSEFENAVAKYVGRPRGVATTSGSAALQLALLAAGVRAGDEVIIPAFVCRAVLNAVKNAGAVPVLADIDAADLTVSVADIEKRITSRCRAIVGVHMFGAPADIEALHEIAADKENVAVIEDAASSIGAKVNGSPVGSFGDISILSFASTKMMTTGQGGMVCTDDAAMLERIRELMDYDCDSSSKGDRAFNYQMTDVQAAIGLAQLKQLPGFLKRRSEIAQKYSEALKGDRLRQISPRRGTASSNYRFIVNAGDEAAAMRKFLRERGIDARGSVAHHLYDYTKADAGNYPVAESLRNRLVSIPIYPSLSDAEADTICEGLRAFLKQ